MTELLAITAETGAVILKLFEELDGGKTVKVDHVTDKRVRKKLRHLCQAVRLTRETKGTLITFRKPEECGVELLRLLKPILLKAVSSSHSKLKQEQAKPTRPVQGPMLPELAPLAAPLARHPWMDLPASLSSVLGEHEGPEKVAQREREQAAMREDWDRLMAQRDNEPLLAKHQRDFFTDEDRSRSRRLLELQKNYDIPWGAPRHVQENTEDDEPWRRFDPEKDLSLANASSVTRESFAELVGRSQLDSRFASGGFESSFV